MSLASGTKLGPYEILGSLGAGGMGEVYRARDTRLGREVALKVLKEGLGGDPSARARFEREARAVAALSHSNILAIHDFGIEGEVFYSVTELLRGETLRGRLDRESLSWRKAVEIGVAIGDGLAAAHAVGIVHRDLKPENVFLTEDGRVKILDFGLARQAPDRAETDSAMPTAARTEPGTVMGTFSYMSPEQVRGLPVDARSDIFSFGSVLYEMLAGRRAFPGTTPPDSMAAILKESPRDLSETGRAVPLALSRVVTRCLEKSPDERFQSARDLTYALREIGSSVGGAIMTSEAMPRRAARPGLRTAAFLAALAGVAGILLALNVGGLRGRLTGAARTAPIRSIAVLPLQNLSGDAAQEYFADGMTEELIARLAQIGGLSVTSLTSIMTYKGTKKRLPEIARELEVEAVLEGSVSRADGKIHVTAQLIEATSDKNLWARTYERDLGDVITLEGEISRAIAQAVRIELTPAQTARLSGARAVNPEGYEAYVRGRYFWNRRDPESLGKAAREFQAALDADPLFARAWSGLADVYCQLAYGNLESPGEAFPKAREAAARALKIDPALGEAHASLGFVKMYLDWDFPAAETEFREAIRLNPGYASAHSWYAYLLTAMEKSPEALAQAREAHRLDPLSPAASTDYGWILHYCGQDSESLKALDAALELNPAFPYAHFWKARVLTLSGRYSDAEKEYAKAASLRSWQPMMSTLGFFYAVSGRPEEARRIAAEFEELRRVGKYSSPYAEAAIWAGLDDKGKALSLLEAAYAERSHWLVWLKRDPRWKSLRSDPRFLALVRKVGLPS